MKPKPKKREKTCVIIAACLFLVGCIEKNWGSASEQYTCTAEQMKKVETETVFCAAHSGYTKPYCYSSAIMRNCTIKPQEIK